MEHIKAKVEPLSTQVTVENIHAPHAVVSGVDSYLRLIDSCITQLKAEGRSENCNESKEEEELPLRDESTSTVHEKNPRQR